MTMRVSKDRIDMDDKVLQKPVLKDYGETVVTENSGYCLDFDGSSDYATISADTSLNNTSFSVCFWIKPDQLRIQHIIKKATFASSWRIFMNDTSGGIEFDSFSDTYNLQSAADIPVDEWTHVAVTYDYGSTTASIYFNGELDNSNTSFTDAGNDQNSNLTIAQATGLDGSLDEIRIFNDALTADEVAAVYAGGTVSSGLVCRIPMDENTGTTAFDTSGNDNDAVFSGSPTWTADGGQSDYTIDLTEANVFNITLTGNCSFTFANPPTSGTAGSFTLLLTQDDVGGRTVLWPSAVSWLGGTEPTLYTGENSENILVFFTYDGGTNWYGQKTFSHDPWVTIVLTSGTSWDVPTDWNSSNNIIHTIGGGGGGAGDAGAGGRGGGGGGAYSSKSNVTLTGGSTVSYQVGSAGTNNGSGTDTYLCNSTSNCGSIVGSAVVVGAKAGAGAGTSTSGASGGSSASGVGDVKYSGGNGGNRNEWGGGGGGGAGGPGGNGGNGGGGDLTGDPQAGGGGGGNGGGTAGEANASDSGGNEDAGGDGGNNALGYGGGAGSASGSVSGGDGVDGGGGGGLGAAGSGGGGGNGGDGIDINGTVGGGGGGGGGSDNTANNKPGNGGLYGGGGGGAGDDSGAQDGDGAQGIIVIRYLST